MASSKKNTTTTSSTTVKARSRAKKAPAPVPEVEVAQAPVPVVVPETLPLHLRALVRVGELAFEASDASLPLAIKVGLHGSTNADKWGVKREGAVLIFVVAREAYLADPGWKRWLADLRGLAKAGGLKAAFSPKGLKVSK